MSNQVSRQRQATAYKNYCQLLQLKSGLNGEALREHIRETVRLSYQALFGSKEIRQRDMTEAQLLRLTEHREDMINLMQLQTK